MTAHPPAGWFDDPEYPGHLRYWDGASWTDHRAPKDAAGPTGGPGRFTDIGDWLGQTFRTLVNCRVGMFGYFVGSIITSLLFGVAALSLWDDVRYVDGDWSGISGGRVLATVGLVIASAFVSLILYLFAAHQLYHGQDEDTVPIEQSLAAAVRAIPRVIGWGLALVALLVVAIVVLAVLTALAPVLGVIGILAVIVGLIWAGVKLAFFIVAAVAPVAGLNTLKGSASVSTGRFWPTFGRLVLLTIIGIVVTLGLNIFVSPFASSPDPDVFDDLIVIEDDELVFLDIGGILEEIDLIGPVVIVSSIPNVLGGLVSLSGIAGLFHQIHPARRESEPAA